MSNKLLALSMVAYIGTKSVLAMPMSRGEYNEYQGWQIPENENPNDPFEGGIFVHNSFDGREATETPLPS